MSHRALAGCALAIAAIAASPTAASTVQRCSPPTGIRYSVEGLIESGVGCEIARHVTVGYLHHHRVPGWRCESAAPSSVAHVTCHQLADSSRTVRFRYRL